MAYATSGHIGANFAATKAGTTTDGAGAEHQLGTVVLGTDGSRWMYVQAGGAITQYSAVAIDENGQAVELTTALTDAGHTIGIAQVAFLDNDFGWVCVQALGNISVRVAANCAPDVQLYTTATAGVVDDTSSGTLIRGLVKIAAATASAESHEAILQNASGTATP